jgi:hypothetical protein
MASSCYGHEVWLCGYSTILIALHSHGGYKIDGEKKQIIDLVRHLDPSEDNKPQKVFNEVNGNCYRWCKQSTD